MGRALALRSRRLVDPSNPPDDLNSRDVPVTLAPELLGPTVLAAAVPAVGTAGNDGVAVIGAAPHAGTVTAVTYIPTAAITGAATNNRRLRLVNKGQAGAGTTVVAEVQYASGVNAAAYDENAVALSGTPANLVVTAGDVLAWESTHINTGITDPGGLARVTLARA